MFEGENEFKLKAKAPLECIATAIHSIRSKFQHNNQCAVSLSDMDISCEHACVVIGGLSDTYEATRATFSHVISFFSAALLHCTPQACTHARTRERALTDENETCTALGTLMATDDERRSYFIERTTGT